MANLFGSLGIADSERAFTSVEGRMLMWEQTQLVFERWQADAEAAMTLFVEGTTENHQERYELPGGGYLQAQDEYSGDHETASVKRSGSWDVAYPIFQYGAALTYDDVSLGYLTVGQYSATVQTILNQNNNTLFRDILNRIFTPTSATYTDKIFGALTLVPLANYGQSTVAGVTDVLYPPVFGSAAEATENMYVASGYAESAISNTNNPFRTVRDKLEPHYGFPQGGSPIVVLMNTSTVQYARALADFDEFTNRYLAPGDDITTLTGLPALPPGMRIVGVCNGCVLAEWPRMPTGYLIGIHAEAPKPLKRRVDRADTGLTPGLQLWSETAGEPYRTARWRNRQGFGVGNRIGAVALQLTSSTYSAPTVG